MPSVRPALAGLRDTAAEHHATWVLVANAVATIGYGLSFLTGWLSGASPFPDAWSDLSACLLCGVGMLLLWRGQVMAAVAITVGAVWLEIHAAIIMSGGPGNTVSLPVFPALVVGTCLLLGGRAGLTLAGLSVVSAPLAIALSRWVRDLPLTGVDVHHMVVVDVVIVGMAILTTLFLHSFEQVLREARVGKDRFVEEQLRLQSQLQQAQKMEAVGRLAGGVAHDFNNLLTVIAAGAEMLKDSADPEVRGLADEIDRAQERGAALTRQLLAFARRDVVQPRALNLGDVVRDLEPLMRKLIGSGVTLNLEVRDAGTVVADAGQVEQVLLNLVANARDATPDGGEVRVELETRGTVVALRVRDTGTGMDENTRARIFEPFFTTKRTGTGLGLATVHGIVNRYGGTIEVETTLGSGTTFTLVWPATLAQPEPPRVTRRAGDGGHRGQGTILLVEDDAPARRLLRQRLERAGYSVVEVVDGAKALTTMTAIRANGTRVDLVLSDVAMPNMNGIELSRRLGEKYPGLPVLLMSGYAEDPQLDLGALDRDVVLLAKPFNLEELLITIGERIRRPGA